MAATIGRDRRGEIGDRGQRHQLTDLGSRERPGEESQHREFALKLGGKRVVVATSQHHRLIRRVERSSNGLGLGRDIGSVDIEADVVDRPGEIDGHRDMVPLSVDGVIGGGGRRRGDGELRDVGVVSEIGADDPLVQSSGVTRAHVDGGAVGHRDDAPVVTGCDGRIVKVEIHPERQGNTVRLADIPDQGNGIRGGLRNRYVGWGLAEIPRPSRRDRLVGE